jgi:ZIP family zinc transporter
VSEAFVWGFAGAFSLVLGGALVLVHRPNTNTLGLTMAFGAGVLLSAVAYELMEESLRIGARSISTAGGFFAGAIVFAIGDVLIGRLGYPNRKDVDGAPTTGSGLSIVLGAVLDGVPESMVIGLTLVEGGEVGVSMLVAVFVSNLPEAVAASSGLLAGGWTKGRVLALWAAIALISGTAAALGFAIGQDASPELSAFVLAFAAGAILDMLATSMVPEAFESSGRPAGLMTTLGFAVALGISTATA